MHPIYRFKKSSLGLLVLAPLLVLGFSNCSPTFKNQGEAATPSHSTANCGGLTGQSPTTIDQAVALMNQLPKPLSVSCFLSTLKPPLKIFAVDNTFSAQPSAGPDDPRIFIFSGNLVISVVPKGPSSEVVEFGQLTSDGLSVKGEVAFPVTASLSPDSPYSHIKDGPIGTSCRICHGAEKRETTITTGEAFKSAIIEPDFYRRVSRNSLFSAALNCNAQENAERCRILGSIFISGKAMDSDFPVYSP